MAEDQMSTRFTSTLSKKTGQKRQVTSDRSNPVKFDTPVLLRNIEPPKEPPIKKGGKPPKEKVDDIPYDEVVSIFNETCTTLEPIIVLTEPRKANIRARWNDGYKLEDFQKVFTNCDGSDHHSGRGGKWVADFNWLLKPTNFDKMLLKKNVEPPKKFPFTLPQMEEGGYSGAIYPDLRGQRFYMEPMEGGKVFDENGNELNLIESDGEGYVAPRL